MNDWNINKFTGQKPLSFISEDVRSVSKVDTVRLGLMEGYATYIFILQYFFSERKFTLGNHFNATIIVDQTYAYGENSMLTAVMYNNYFNARSGEKKVIGLLCYVN